MAIQDEFTGYAWIHCITHDDSHHARYIREWSWKLEENDYKNSAKVYAQTKSVQAWFPFLLPPKKADPHSCHSSLPQKNIQRENSMGP